MRSLSVLPVLSTLSLLLNYALHAAATPLAAEADIFGENRLEKRCDNPCGYNDWLCCETGQTCSTNSAQEAVCADSSSGDYQYYTTTYVLTNTDLTTVTSVWSSQIAATTSAGTCRADLGETTCGTTCCDAAQECDNGQCVAESSSAIVTATATGTDSGSEATPGVRGTSNGASTVTATSAPTTTEGFTAPVGTDGADLIGAQASGGGLSGGAIAGIVIGSIVGAFLLLLLCACICFRGVLAGLLAALGIGKKRRRQETTYVEERHSHHSHGSRPPPPAPARRTWFGSRPAAEGSDVSEKKESKWGWGTIAIIFGALALCLGLRRSREHDDAKTESSYPSSYYYYSDYYSGSSSRSSDRRTRDTRRSRQSRTRP
ncbi:hypothetical protein DTO006G1_1761 [Penicillium roqueforti]|uniref:uncharacterized protein n=1 Tax=Penicillium roqueforti TaxID=5082 RepID=UPI00190DB5B2|nr:uncharacterized protein LCP9604111_3646 [Penicillium roqueforti]KAF9250130.1 hypothetical protein LCP9604111_3646 [Penicillium roqueforti]KAI1831464.1 hypothetical protein CBS147337_7620 [Penicillium roqueforti]KAI2679581.1 hypothetical protein CBS147355_4063 [Penicillium roqueforti]KAI2701021.1 hypothetical protein CBS147372_5091 [Penicillium roqueforti]KAI2717085.1 hypothetical protein CBS147318_5212 [Penicillium roqueforti]